MRNPVLYIEFNLHGEVKRDTKHKRFHIQIRNGEPVREKCNSLKAYGLTVIQAVVTEIDGKQPLTIDCNCKRKR